MTSQRTSIFAPLLVLLAIVAHALAYYPQGSITVPANGTKITPGQAFNFTYNIRSDYCVSSYNYTVFLFTAVPTGASLFIGPDNQVFTGHTFGRFSGAQYPCACFRLFRGRP